MAIIHIYVYVISMGGHLLVDLMDCMIVKATLLPIPASLYIIGFIKNVAWTTFLKNVLKTVFAGLPLCRSLARMEI